MRITGTPWGSVTAGSRSRNESSYGRLSAAATRRPTELPLAASHAFQAGPQRGTDGGVESAVAIGFASASALMQPPPTKPRPVWSKLSALKSSSEVHCGQVPPKRFSRRPGKTPSTPT